MLIFTRIAASTRLADVAAMTERTRSVQHPTDIAGRLFRHTGALIAGFIMMVVGLAMTITIVMFPAGVVITLLGVAMLRRRLLRSRFQTVQRALVFDAGATRVVRWTEGGVLLCSPRISIFRS